MLILLVHTEQYFFENKIYTFLENGQLGVQLFYLVSAFTLMLSCKSRETEKFFIEKFFIRRFFRIAPLYYLVTIYYAFERYLGFDLTKVSDNLHQLPLIKLITGLLFVNGLYPTTINSFVPGGWSIATEMIFYLTLPFLFKRVRNIRHSVYLFAIALLLSVLFSYITKLSFFNRGGFPMFNFLNQFPMFCLGILAYFIVYDGFSNFRNTEYLLIALLFLGGCYLPLPYYFPYSLFFVFLLVGLTKSAPLFIVNRFTKLIGNLSFSIYLIHFAVLYWVNTVLDFKYIVFSNEFVHWLFYILFYIGVLAISSTISFFSYNLIEKSGKTFGKKIINSLDILVTNRK